jgi:ribosomal protein S18 acetylase RimI-like enzyme
MEVRNHQDKEELLDRGRAHGILVYANGEPVGWCQYGPADELPGAGRGRKSPRVAPAGGMAKDGTAKDGTAKDGTAKDGTAKDGTAKDGRVTCLVVDKMHRRQGVAGLALRAALEAIRKSGGGLVVAYRLRDLPDRAGHASALARHLDE